jgi:hypothetical protein
MNGPTVIALATGALAQAAAEEQDTRSRDNGAEPLGGAAVQELLAKRQEGIRVG